MKSNEQKKNVLDFSRSVKRNILDMSLQAGASSAHIGGALSIAEVLGVIYSNFNIKAFKHLDRFILSKGHGFLALLSVLYCKNFIKKKKFYNFKKMEVSLLHIQ